MAAEGRLLFHITDFERKLDIVTKKSADASRRVRQESQGLGSSLSQGLSSGLKMAMPAIGVAAIGAQIKASLGKADDLADLKIALGETAETLQRVDFAARQTASVGVDQLGNSMLKLEKNLGDVESKEAAEALANLGLTAHDLAAMTLDQKILALSEAFQKARADGTGVKDIMDLLGRSGAELIPMLGQSKEALTALFEEAPVVADAMIDQMAAMNDRLDGMFDKAKSNAMSYVGLLVQIGTIVKDTFKTGSLNEALIMEADRATASAQATQKAIDDKAAQSAAMESARAAKEEAAAREKSAEAAKKAGEEIEKTKEAIERSEFDLLPDDAKIAALKGKLEEMLKSTVGNFSLNFDTSIDGLEALAKSREAMGDKLPATGVNSAAEAFQWLREAKELARDRAALEKQIAEKEKTAADAKAKELDGLREKAEDGEFQLMDPEEQARALTDKLSKSFGFDISGVEDVERGLSEARDRVRAARESGDATAEAAALKQLTDAQDAARDLASSTGGKGQDATVNGRGTVAGAIANIFGRSSSDLQLDEAKAQTTLLSRIETVLAEIRDSEVPDTFGQPTFRYP